MEHREAIDLLSVPGNYTSGEQQWADLGCGTGTFTLALAHFLAAGSQIIAIDKDQRSLNKIPGDFKQVLIEKRVGDFVKDSFWFKNLDGILMANSLHYIQHQEAFINRAKKFLKFDGCFLIVEYDTNRSNSWIPYPLRFDRLTQIFKNAGFSSIKKINEKPSRYNRSNLYSAIIQQLPPNL